MSKKALFLDRVGVINVNYGYVHEQKNFDFIEGIFDLVRLAKSNDFLVFVITNQAGIARGYYSIEDFNVLREVAPFVWTAKPGSISGSKPVV